MIDFSKLDKTIHEKSRLSIMTLLAASSDRAFQDLKRELNLSDGNLITHLRALHKSGFVSIAKEVDKRPLTKYALTAKGRSAFEDYLNILEEIVNLGKPE